MARVRGPFTRKRAMKSPLWKLTMEELEKKLAVTRHGGGYVVKKFSQLHQRQIEYRDYYKKERKEMDTIRFIMFLKRDDEELDKLAEKGVDISKIHTLRSLQDIRWKDMEQERKQKEHDRASALRAAAAERWIVEQARKQKEHEQYLLLQRVCQQCPQ